ncbi:bifunctional 4-hydroxy-2-oxoglutarate aldolase/2-dehydro-3-deoxy-phosphogluconate aldolase [Mumia zhuanghuii]|uniref:Bifunctional 4-hydroxy-2-oxoglutarate aldolase/2-dehydro-3-deoxy-phosphogluconate aldolase n=2 Tax=Mumia TaxID=1546255 RepID=A0ABW1QL55_9ACTN|nr:MULTISPECIES: bifunctional 4-hydroxy-2-oxoglutarate aldolase/2-dehydro-3-deoxy-phosphogluconate aldolase [Mumia]KAA1418293.1 bifunctional 4-hydroxy-2-oxoglutarate aldolase/2-dehydro-3-deoxy-phosphogluconate aldolase [Mumia zhuanghuii]
MATPPAATSRITGVVAIIRLRDRPAPDRLVDALIAGGVEHLEVTATTPDAHATVERWRRRHPEALVGVGTVRTPAQAEAAISAGATFLVTPTTVPGVLEVARTHDIPVACGALTPTEIDNAWLLGADTVKVFPITAVGGPDYLRALRDPLPDVPLLPTGGVDAGNLRAYAGAGAAGVGIGSALVSEARVAAEQWDVVRDHARSLTDAWKGHA